MVGRLIPLLVLLISGCATTLTSEERLARDDEREWKDQIDLENWLMCDSMGIMFVHYDHGHSRWDRGRRVSRWHIKSDLRHNPCYIALGNMWIHY